MTTERTPVARGSNDGLGLVPDRDALAEQLSCVRQALPEHWRDSVPSVVVATLVADNALLKATEQRLRRLLEGADRRAVAHGKEFSELTAQAADVAGERAANAALTDEVERLRAAITEALPFTLKIGQRVLTDALGPNVPMSRTQQP